MGISKASAGRGAVTKLTKTKVESFSAPVEGQIFHWDSETKGFAVRITASGARSYIVQGRVNGKTRRFTLGPHGLLTVDEARKRALAKLLAMYDGIDPQVEKKRSVAQGITLREVMKDYLAHKRTKHGELKATSKADIEKHVTKTFAAWADKPVVQINRDACVKKFRELSKTAPGQANQAFRNLRALLNWARETNATNEGTYPILPVNPVALMFKSEKWNPEKPRETRIPNDKIGPVWNMLSEYRGHDENSAATSTSADLIAFMLLTGTRIGEATKLKWHMVSLGGKPMPTLYLQDTKNHNPITIPVSDVLGDLLTNRKAAQVKDSEYVFPSRVAGGSYMADPRALMRKVSEIAGVHLSPHDLRRTFLAVAYECGVEMWRAELLTNHAPSTITIKHYTETSDLRYLSPEVQRIANWIIAQGALAKATEPTENLVIQRA